MAAEYKTLGTIQYVVDTETSSWKMGEINVSLDIDDLKRYIKSYGTSALYEGIASLHHKIVETVREVNQERQELFSVIEQSCKEQGGRVKSIEILKNNINHFKDMLNSASEGDKSTIELNIRVAEIELGRLLEGGTLSLTMNQISKDKETDNGFGQV